MASEVHICNLALARLGDEASVVSIEPPDQSPQATYCALFYPLAVAELLDAHNWSFAAKVTPLAALTNSDARWQYCYALPSDLVTVSSVFGATDTEYLQRSSPAFSVGVNSDGLPCLFTNQVDAAIAYAAQIKNPDVFPPAVVSALSWLLASNLAGVIIKGDTGAAAAVKMLQGYQLALNAAKESDSQNRHVASAVYIPSAIASRA